MRVFVKDNTIPIRVIHEIVIRSEEDFKWIETLKGSVGPNDVDLTDYEIRRVCVDLDYVSIYVRPKENTNGQNRHNPDPS